MNRQELISLKALSFKSEIAAGTLKIFGATAEARSAENLPLEQYTEKDMIYWYRAFKCKQVLMNEYNWIHIRFMIPYFVCELLGRAYLEMNTTSGRVNSCLISELLDMFLKRDTETTLMAMLHYNFPFILLYNIEHVSLRELLLNLLNFSSNLYKLSSSQLKKLSKYLKLTSFFIDYIQVILDKNFKFNTKKIEISFKPKELTKLAEDYNRMLFHLNAKASRLRKAPLLCGINRSTRIASVYEDYTVVEERTAIKGDIDRVKDHLQHELNITPIEDVSTLRSLYLQDQEQELTQPDEHQLSAPKIKKRDMSLENSALNSPPPKPTKAYPSLVESIKKEEESSRPREKSVPRYLSQKPNVRETSKDPQASISRDVSPVMISVRKQDSHLKDSQVPSRGQIPSRGQVTSRTTIAADVTPQTPVHGTTTRDKRSDSNVNKKSPQRVLLAQLTASPMLKLVHPDVKQQIYVSHFQNMNAPLTQAVVTSGALPSKMLGRTSSLPQLMKGVREIPVYDEYERSSDLKMFSPKTVKANEGQAYPLAEALYDIVRYYFENYKQTGLMLGIGLENSAKFKLLQCIQGAGDDTMFFNILLKNYLYKPALMPDQTEGSSVVCGRIVNEILSRL